MTTQEAIEKLKNYDELEGKYNQALARIDEYERERKEIADTACKALANPEMYVYHTGLIAIANMLTTEPAPEDDIKVGDVVERNGKKGLVIYTYESVRFREMITVIPSIWGNYPETEIWEVDENVQKTGKHYPQTAEILAELRGENDESSENPE